MQFEGRATPDRDEVLRQVLEIVDLFEDENRRMAIDDALQRLEAAGANLEPGAPIEITPDRLIHTAMSLAARNIGDAIRQKFGLPAKEEKQ